MLAGDWLAVMWPDMFIGNVALDLKPQADEINVNLLYIDNATSTASN